MARKKPIPKESTWIARQTERRVLLWCFLSFAVGFLLFLSQTHHRGESFVWQDFLPLITYGMGLFVVHATFVLFKSDADQLLPGATLFLSGFGILAQIRLGSFDPSNLARLSNYAWPICTIVMLIVWLSFRHNRFELLAKLRWPALLLSIGLIVALLLMGQRFRGSIYGPWKMTPTEVIKLLWVIFVAAHLAMHQDTLRSKDGSGPWFPFLTWLPLIGGIGALGALLVLQRDLGMMFILSAILVGLLYLATGHKRYLMYAIGTVIVAAIPAYAFFEHGRQRFASWLDPFADPTGSGWQILQGLSGMYAGGLWGAGFGMGNPERIPIAESDFIYAVIGEEMGFIGCLLVILFYAILASRGLKLARSQTSSFAMLLVGGLTLVIVGQAFLNIAGVTKLLPLTGITLPFISHGGSSLLTAFICLGLCLAVSDSSTQNK